MSRQTFRLPLQHGKTRTGAIRLRIDPGSLNEELKRPHYLLPTIEDVLLRIHRAKVFMVSNAQSCYWHVRLDTESSRLTAWLLWMCLPFGIAPAPAQRKSDSILQPLQNTARRVDDIIAWGDGDPCKRPARDHDQHLHSLLTTPTKWSVKLQPDKLKLCLSGVISAGYHLEDKKMDGVNVTVINYMPVPTDSQGPWRFLGMVNVLAHM